MSNRLFQSSTCFKSKPPFNLDPFSIVLLSFSMTSRIQAFAPSVLLIGVSGFDTDYLYSRFLTTQSTVLRSKSLHNNDDSGEPCFAGPLFNLSKKSLSDHLVHKSTPQDDQDLNYIKRPVGKPVLTSSEVLSQVPHYIALIVAILFPGHHVWFKEKRQRYSASPQHGDLRLSGPPSGQGAGGGARARDRGVTADLRTATPSTVPPPPPDKVHTFHQDIA
ncbi:hypothetical protein PoB_005343300 [Plakobranchus ocellatus]|uniref:Uncharacterized protein n=1 Tax=Plakobranchus ocellatus TaxID=259542 RepID=A0AAV4C631_9GAST|nr:hypothetical protein PoB_005343300 [Plakobranchus ocellatus]